MPGLNDAIDYAKRNHDRDLAELKQILAIPSISTLPSHEPDLQRAAEWMASQLRELGFKKVEIMPTGGHPVVYGEMLDAPGKPTVLAYGHYDVQPVDPLNEWVSPPFEPTIRGDNIYARGASDMKGQAHAFLKAVEAWVKNGGMPVNVKVMFEGEEELGSPHLGEFIAAHKDKLKADMVLNTDSGILKADVPALTYGLRGLVYFEIWVYGPQHDLHSGGFGGSIKNPAQALCELIAGMHDKDGRVTLPGFYNKVRVLSKEEREELARLPDTDEEWLKMTGVPQLDGEKGFTRIERLGARPTLEVNGILSGFVSEGVKTVLPAKAMAKVSMRLVPNQNPADIAKQLRQYMEKNAPPTIRWEIIEKSAASPVLVERDSPGMRAAIAALEEVFGSKPVMKLEGGTVPMVNMVQSQLGVGSIQLGFSLPDDNFHAPNEKLHLPSYFRGIETYIRFFDNVAKG